MPKRQPDIRALARRQRWIIWLVLLALIAQVIPFMTLWLAPQVQFPVFVSVTLLRLAIYVATAVGVLFLLLAQGRHVAVVVVVTLLCFIPCGNLLMLVAVNMSATRTLRNAGLRVGFLGVDPEEVERIIDPMLCSSCGYNLTGNVSGMCPECGVAVAMVAPPPAHPPTT